MSDTDLGLMDARQLAALFESGAASPLEATRAAFERIDRFNAAVNAYVYLDREGASFSYPFNLSQQPAASVPCGFTDDGLPVGFQLAGGKHDDARVLRVCHAFMSAYPPRFPDCPDPGRP